MDKNKSIQVLQAYATGLAAQSYGHRVQSNIFADQGFGKLAEKYADPAAIVKAVEAAGYSCTEA